MRNCFVPGCDLYCKQNRISHRKMFIAPKDMVEKWANVVKNKKRELNKNDRICERHFEESDVIQFWESNINGQVHLTPRDKPKLRDSAIPTKNLGSDAKKSSTKQQNSSMKRKVIEIRPTVLKAKTCKIEETNEIMENFDVMLPEDIILTETSDEVSQKSDISEVDTKSIAMFETLYDEAFDVELPSLLWGIHRDPEKKFVAFTEFNLKLLNVSCTLFISDSLTYKIIVNGLTKSCSKLKSDEMSITEQVSELLNNLDKQI